MRQASAPRALFVLCCLATASARAADGELDLTFAGDGKQTVAFDLGQGDHDRAHAVAGSGDGRIVLVGDIQRASDGDTDFGVVALDSDGAPDTDFGSGLNGKALFAFDLGADFADLAQAVAAMPDGRIAMCGRANYDAPLSTANRLAVGRLLPTGLHDSAFGGDGKVVLTPFGHVDSSNGDCRSIVAHPDGRIVVPFVNETQYQTGLIRLEADGDPDPTFGGDGISELPTCGTGSTACRLLRVLLLPGGKYMAIGLKVVELGPGDLVVRLFFARYTSAGLLDDSFNGDGQAIVTVPPGNAEFEEPMDAALDPAGRVVVLERASGPVDAFYLVRIDSNGEVDETFGFSGWTHVELTTTVGDAEEANGLLIQGDGRIVVTGYFRLNVTDYDCIAIRLNPTATVFDIDFGSFGRRGIAFDLGTTANTDQCFEVSASDGRPILAGQVMVGVSFDFAAARLTNAYIFADGFESASRFFWSSAAL